MRWLWRLLLLCVVAICALLALYIFSPTWIPHAVIWLLPDNIELRELELQRAESGELSVPELRLSLVQSNSESIELDINNAVLSYDYDSLREGRILSLKLESAHIQLPEHYAQASESAASNQTLTDVLPAAWIGLLPFDEFSLQELTISRPGVSVFENWKGRAELKQGVFDFSAASAGDQPWQITANANLSNELHVNVEKGGQKIVAIQTALHSDATNTTKAPRLVGESTLELATLTALLQELVILSPSLNFSGVLESDWTLELPAELNRINSKNMRLAGALRGKVTAKEEALGTLACQPGKENNRDLLGRYSWFAGSVTLLELTARCQGDMRTDFIPPSVQRTGLNGELNYQLQVNDSAVLEYNLQQRQLDLKVEAADEQALTADIELINADSKKALSGRLELESVFYKAMDEDINRADSDSRGFNAQLVGSSYLDVPSLQLQPYSASDISLRAKAAVQLGKDTIELSLQPAATITASDLSWLDGGTQRLQIKTLDNLTLILNPGKVSVSDSALQLSGKPIQAFGPEFKYDALQAGTRGINISYAKNELAQFFGQLKFQLSDVIVTQNELTSHPMQLGVDLSAAGSTLAGELSLRPAADSTVSSFSVNGNFEHDVRSNVGQLKVQTPELQFDEENRFLPSLVQQWPYPLDFSSGALTLSAAINWQRAAASSDFAVSFEDTGGFYQRNLFYGVKGSLHGHYESGLFSARSNNLTATKLVSGVSFNNISIDLQPELNTRHIVQLETGFMGGRARIKDIVLQAGKQDYKVDVDLSGVNLEQLLQLEGGVSGSGTLDASLPLVISKAGVRMDQGRLSVREPGGVIQYRGNIPQAALDSNPQLGLALGALRNFHYDVLNVDASYLESGKLILKTRLEGRNPDTSSGRPVHFNLNVTEDVPALLKSLQLTQTISDKLEARIQQLAEPN